MEKFRIWYLTYQVEITWFVIGWLSIEGIRALSEGRLLMALFDFGLVFVNYSFWKTQ